MSDCVHKPTYHETLTLAEQIERFSAAWPQMVGIFTACTPEMLASKHTLETSDHFVLVIGPTETPEDYAIRVKAALIDKIRELKSFLPVEDLLAAGL